ncbi:MAG: type II secretion system protein, partial [Candidatus Saccharibacteria bacterium]|nr:type II secretion system protein [Candidatus Saccharibacteria bacterium]
VEVMIVLAIAGLILAVVFIAVPALQKNSRDTQRKTDIGAIRGAVATYTSNNRGVLPDDATKLSTVLANVDQSFYTDDSASGFAINTGSQAPFKVYIEKRDDVVATDSLPEVDTVHIIVGAKCATRGITAIDGSPTGASGATDVEEYAVDAGTLTETATLRGYAIVYQLENSDGKLTCEDN